jgi:hypothetical protein
MLTNAFLEELQLKMEDDLRVLKQVQDLVAKVKEGVCECCLAKLEAAPSPQPGTADNFFGLEPVFRHKPQKLGWRCIGGNERTCVVYFEKDWQGEVVKLGYYFTTGSVQLTQENVHDLWPANDASYRSNRPPRRIQETFTSLDGNRFQSLLSNPYKFYGTSGQFTRKSTNCSYDNDSDDSAYSSYY